jgi:hypothetical protein
MSRRAWIVLASQLFEANCLPEAVVCPVCGVAGMDVRWLSNGADGGELQLRCPACGAENFALSRSAPGWVAAGSSPLAGAGEVAEFVAGGEGVDGVGDGGLVFGVEFVDGGESGVDG